MGLGLAFTDVLVDAAWSSGKPWAARSSPPVGRIQIASILVGGR
jgi:hypothetical protein